MACTALRTWPAVLLFISLSCQVGCRQKEDDEWVPLVPGGKADLVAVLRAGITYEEIVSFQEEELIVGDFERGHWHRPGIDGTMQVRVGGHEAFGVLFDPAATAEQRNAIREGLMSSPYVFRVFEDVTPGEIDLSEDEADSQAGEGIPQE